MPILTAWTLSRVLVDSRTSTCKGTIFSFSAIASIANLPAHYQILCCWLGAMLAFLRMLAYLAFLNESSEASGQVCEAIPLALAPHRKWRQTNLCIHWDILQEPLMAHLMLPSSRRWYRAGRDYLERLDSEQKLARESGTELLPVLQTQVQNMQSSKPAIVDRLATLQQQLQQMGQNHPAWAGYLIASSSNGRMRRYPLNWKVSELFC